MGQLQEAKIGECSAIAKVDHRAAYIQLQVDEQRKELAVVTLQGLDIRATAAAPQYSPVSGVMATIAVRRLKVVRRFRNAYRFFQLNFFLDSTRVSRRGGGFRLR